MFIIFDTLCWGHLEQRSPTFVSPGTGFVEDSFSMDWGQGMVQGVMREMGSNGERQMKLHSLARRSPPAVALFLTGRGPVPICGPGVGDP